MVSSTSPPSPPPPATNVPASPQRSSRIPKRKQSLSSGGSAAASHAIGNTKMTEGQQRHSSMPTPGPSRPPPLATETREHELRSPLPLHLQSHPSRHQQSTSFSPTSHAHPPQIRFPSTSQPASPSHPSASRPQSHHPPQHAPSPRRCSMPRPKMERPSSTTYTSFPLRAPRTPGDEEDERRRGLSWGNRLLAPFTSTKAGLNGRDLESGVPEGSGEREGLLSPNDARSRTSQEDGQACVREREGLPKLSRSCFIAEVKCYGKYMLPPIIFFVFVALTIALYVYGKTVEHESGGGGGGGGALAESP